ncbi:MAG: formate dehydrogenase major subunit, partial [Gammaproteobacteria bacterium]
AAIGGSTCVGCGECVQACPTGALINKVEVPEEVKKTDSVCPYCGVGCLLTYHSKDNKIVKVEGRDGPANISRLCVKGRYGFDYIHHPERLTQPMIRKEGVPKGMNEYFDPADPSKMFRPVSWEEALQAAGGGLKTLLDEHGDEVLAGFGSAKGSNEEAYLFQKIVRTGFRNNNIDHCTRLCHASSVMALLEGIGSGAVSNPVEDVKHADLIFIIGSNTTGNHPVAATFVKNAQKNGAKLVVLDPRRIDIARHADHFLQFKPDTDVVLLNAMLHTLIDEDLLDHEFIANRTNNFEQVKANVADFSPEAMADICGIDAQTIRQVSREYANAKNAIIFWGMGVSQHIHGTDNVRCLISLCMLTGQIGRRGTGLHPLRGQNNVQGASDAGLIPMMYPDYQRVDNPETHARYEQAWDTVLSTKPGLTVVEIMHAIDAGTIKGMYIMGENPAMSDPNLNHARHALETLEHLVVQDIFLTETAAFADIILPATAWPEKDGSVTNTDRRVQRGRKAVDAPGDAMPDAWIIQEMAKHLECGWPEQSIGEVYEEMRSMMPSLTGITWDRLTENDSVTYPCKDANDPGQQVVFVDSFPMPDGKAKLVPAKHITADELPDAEYPFVLMTGRKLEHWHTGSMTRRADVLDQIEPSPAIDMNPVDIVKLGRNNGDMVTVQSRRGEIFVEINSSLQVQPGEVFMPFCFNEAAANLLTNEAIDPVGKIPEFKFCAVSIQ